MAAKSRELYFILKIDESPKEATPGKQLAQEGAVLRGVERRIE